MIDVLLSKPDNTRISEHELLIEALKGENVWWEEDGNSYNGTKITDIELHNGKYLHDYIEWNFENGVWHDTISQALTLCEKFHKRKELKAYLRDYSHIAGMKLGMPHNIGKYYRNIRNLLLSFKLIDAVTCYGAKNAIYSCKTLEIVEHIVYDHHYSHEDYYAEFDSISPIKLLIIPPGVTTEKFFHDEFNLIYIVKGKCTFASHRWLYRHYYGEKLSWREESIIKKMKGKQYASQYASKSDYQKRPVTAKHRAWFQFSNIGKSDLLIFLINRSTFRQENLIEKRTRK